MGAARDGAVVSNIYSMQIPDHVWQVKWKEEGGRGVAGREDQVKGVCRGADGSGGV